MLEEYTKVYPFRMRIILEALRLRTFLRQFGLGVKVIHETMSLRVESLSLLLGRRFWWNAGKGAVFLLTGKEVESKAFQLT